MIEGERAGFHIFSIEPLTATVVTPFGRVIDPSVAERDPTITYRSVHGNLFNAMGWTTLYWITKPPAGPWQIVLTTPVANDAGLWVSVESQYQLQAHAAEPAYQPGELVTVQASLLHGATPMIGVTITGTVELPDESKVVLPFYDDGTTGDVTPGDGLYHAQFIAPAMNGWPQLHVRAVRGNIARQTEFSVNIVGPTALSLIW